MSDQTDTITIEARYCGPPVSGNGGWAAGSLAAHVPGVAEVTLRRPPPLDQPMMIVAGRDGGVAAGDEAGLVMEARPVDGLGEVDIPAVSLTQAIEADDPTAAVYRDHPFPTCFVCGPARSPGDGLCLHPGPVTGLTGVVASPWAPHPSLAAPDGHLDRRAVWAALDCPGAMAHIFDGHACVLGRLAVEIHDLPIIGADHVVLGWAGEPSGRKLPAHTAIVDPTTGSALAVGRSTWIEVDPAAFT